MKPLLKYKGGKYNEYSDIKSLLPERINNYYEPFFGGGGIFFRLHIDKKIIGKSYINDISKSLMEFYKSISDDTFRDSLYAISDAWDFIKNFAELFYDKYKESVIKQLVNKENKPFVNYEIRDYIKNEMSKCEFDTHGFSLTDRIEKSLNDKICRYIKLRFDEDIEKFAYKCITTSICQAFYFIIRDMYNDWNNHGHFDEYTHNERSSHYFFIREFCFGSMFRFGSNGDFNVPYGGYSYNNKCFTCKIENIISKETKELFNKTEISCDDFENVIKQGKYEEDDFMFLDPPYDSIFSEYDNYQFNKDCHIRLANALRDCKCKWMLVIGKTDFIMELYKDYNMFEYSKTYNYQARGEYETKHTKHMVITNY